jgi:DNA-binding HxlR family transcriptional regulator
MKTREEGAMLKALFGNHKKKTDNDAIVEAVVSQTSALINNLHQQMDLRFREVSAQIKEVELGLAQLETKLLTKDLKDKQAYGMLHYKLHEVKHEKLEDEISSLERNLQSRKTTIKDQ